MRRRAGRYGLDHGIVKVRMMICPMEQDGILIAISLQQAGQRREGDEVLSRGPRSPLFENRHLMV